jgi:CrcB protein
MSGGFVAVGFGAALGAWLRWGLSVWLNPRAPHFPLRTLASNLIGGYLVGFAVAFFAARTELPPEVRLFVITGFLGDLRPFRRFRPKSRSSSCAASIGRAAASPSCIVGSLLLTVAGIATFRALAA